MLFSKTIFKYSQLQQKLIAHSLPYVHKYGWTDNAILAACTNLDLSPASHRIITPYHMISHCMRKWNQQALRIVDDSNFEGKKKIREKVHFSIQTRLQLELQYIDTWHQAMGIGAHPDNISETKQILWEYSDEIWRRCGDKSTDYNYYTKRILFNTAYASTELHLLTDQSSGKVASWQFLDRRLDDILNVGKGIQDLKTVGGAAVDGIFSLIGGFRTPPASQIKEPVHKYKNQPVSSDESSKKKLEESQKSQISK